MAVAEGAGRRRGLGQGVYVMAHLVNKEWDETEIPQVLLHLVVIMSQQVQAPTEGGCILLFVPYFFVIP